jgi:diguanylate cyclase (GGDEF)-like protein/PAS domain S-box-containing protein
VIAGYAFLVALTSAVLLWFRLPDPFMIFLIVPVFFVGIGHSARVHRWMIMTLAIAAIWVEIKLSLNIYASLITTVTLTITVLIVIELLRRFDARRSQAESMLETQRDLAAALGSMNSLDEALSKILDAACSLVGLDSGGLHLVDPATGSYHLAVHRGVSPALAENLAFFAKDSQQARLISAGHPIYQPYAALIPLLSTDSPLNEGLRAAAILPVIYQGKLIAALGIGSHTLKTVPSTTRHALESIATQVGDVIARIRAEEASQESRINFQSFFDTLDDFLFILNEEGQILHYNPLVAHRLGYSDQELSQMNLVDLHPPEQKEEVQRIFASMLAGDLSTSPIPLMTKAGEKIAVETKAVRGRWNDQEVLFGISRDISERQQAEEALRQNEELYRTLIESQGEGLAIVDQDENFIFANPAADHIFGMPKGSLAGHNLNEFVNTGQFEAIRSETAKRMRGERSSYEMVIQLPDGELRSLLTTVTPRYEKNGEFTGSFGIFRDITERAKAEEALRASEQKLRQANEQLTKWLNELEAHNQETSLLKEMGDLLQSCHEVEEAYQVFDQFIPQLFPATGGVLYVFENNDGSLEAVSTWGGNNEEALQINREDCWALRRGRPHRVDDPQKGLLCPHAQISAGQSSLCLPMVAQSESIGLLHIYFSLDSCPEGLDYTEWLDNHENLAITLADQIGMALANLKMHKILSEQVNHDPLTGLFNQKYLQEALQREIHRSIRKEEPLSLLIVDLDHMSEINARYGQEAGNEVLATAAKFLKGHLRPGEMACRYHGDVFMLIFPDVACEAAWQRAEELREEFKLLRVERQDKVIEPMTLSIGIATYPEQGKDNEDLLHAVEAALSLAKSGGYDRVCLPG